MECKVNFLRIVLQFGKIVTLFSVQLLRDEFMMRLRG